MGKYKILTLTQGDNLENFNGKIIKVLSEKSYSDFYKDVWVLICLVELPVNKMIFDVNREGEK